MWGLVEGGHVLVHGLEGGTTAIPAKSVHVKPSLHPERTTHLRRVHPEPATDLVRATWESLVTAMTDQARRSGYRSTRPMPIKCDATLGGPYPRPLTSY